MKNQKQSIRKIVGFSITLKRMEDSGCPISSDRSCGARTNFVDSIDSILREYPISTLLVWKTSSRIRRRRFIDSWKEFASA